MKRKWKEKGRQKGKRGNRGIKASERMDTGERSCQMCCLENHTTPLISYIS